MKQWLHDFFGHPWVDCKEAADGADGRADEDQLGLEPSAIDSPRPQYSTEGNGRPHRTAVFDFRFRARYEPQLVLQSVCAKRPDPLRSIRML